MSNKYHIQGSAVYIANGLNYNPPVDLIPTGTYNISFDMKIGYFLEVAPKFTLPKKLYGNTVSVAGRILQTYQDRPGTTGVLLAGTKGSGKSLAMKQVSVEGLKLGIPTLIVPSAFCGAMFNQFIASIEQEVILIFDEFEKVYDKDQQNALLTLFDGIYSTKKLFLLTANDRYSINDYMNNRPGRIYYSLQYKGLDAAFVREYAEDVLKDKSYIDKIVAFASLSSDFNFDMLQALCEELNRYGEPIREALVMLNIKQDDYQPNYDVKYYDKKGVQLNPKLVGPAVTKRLFTADTFVYTVTRPDVPKHEQPRTQDEWFEDDVINDSDDWEDQIKKFTVVTSGDHVTRAPDLSEVIVEGPEHRIVFTKQVPTVYSFGDIY